MNGRPAPRFLLPSYFWAMRCRYHFKRVSGDAIEAHSAIFFGPPSIFALMAKRFRWESVNRSRFFPRGLSQYVIFSLKIGNHLGAAGDSSTMAKMTSKN
jgi:hypothetical protein